MKYLEKRLTKLEKAVEELQRQIDILKLKRGDQMDIYVAKPYKIYEGVVTECPNLDCKEVMRKEHADYRSKCIHCGQKFKIEKE